MTVSRDEFDALASRVRDVEQRQDAHAVVVAAALQRVESRLDVVDARLGELVPLVRAIARRLDVEGA